MLGSMQVLERIQNIVINTLRTAFSVNTDFLYTADRGTTKIAIIGSYPQDMYPYPTVIVLPPKGDLSPRTFADNLLNEIYGDRVIDGVTMNGLCYQVFGGTIEGNIEIVVIGNNGSIRKKIVDWINTYLSGTFRSIFEANGIEITSLGYTGETVDIYGATLLHTSNIDLGIFTEWNRVVWSDAELIGDIIVNVSSILPDGTTI